jgi:hypothetical protein
VIALPDQAEQELKPQNANALTAAGNTGKRNRSLGSG